MGDFPSSLTVLISHLVAILFRHLKNCLSSKRYDEDEELKISVQNWLKSHAAEFCAEGLKKLVSRFQKRLE